jgi:hypothetical protein
LQFTQVRREIRFAAAHDGAVDDAISIQEYGPLI